MQSIGWALQTHLRAGCVLGCAFSAILSVARAPSSACATERVWSSSRYGNCPVHANMRDVLSARVGVDWTINAKEAKDEEKLV